MGNQAKAGTEGKRIAEARSLVFYWDRIRASAFGGDQGGRKRRRSSWLCMISSLEADQSDKIMGVHIITACGKEQHVKILQARDR